MAALASVMNAYQELDGVPCAANRWLLTDVLRGEWGFDGTGRVRLLRHQAARRVPPRRRSSWSDAAVLALHARASTSSSPAPSATATRCGRRSTAARSRWPTSTRRCGGRSSSSSASASFERPYVDDGSVHVHTRPPKQIELAREVAADSLVLLRNDGVLPLASPTTVAVIGPERGERRGTCSATTATSPTSSRCSRC